jgi:hypothetical protein
MSYCTRRAFRCAVRIAFAALFAVGAVSSATAQQLAYVAAPVAESGCAEQDGHPTYNQFRGDIASLFPGYANSSGAVGFFVFDSTTLTNGVHTISWSVTDNAGHTSGMGSRYFTVGNGVSSGLSGQPAASTRTLESASLAQNRPSGLHSVRPHALDFRRRPKAAR